MKLKFINEVSLCGCCNNHELIFSTLQNNPFLPPTKAGKEKKKSKEVFNQTKLCRALRKNNPMRNIDYHSKYFLLKRNICLKTGFVFSYPLISLNQAYRLLHPWYIWLYVELHHLICLSCLSNKKLSFKKYQPIFSVTFIYILLPPFEIPLILDEFQVSKEGCWTGEGHTTCELRTQLQIILAKIFYQLLRKCQIFFALLREYVIEKPHLCSLNDTLVFP